MSMLHDLGRNPNCPPVLVCVDLQREYLTGGRRHLAADADDALKACRSIVDLWRRQLWPVVHVKRVAQAPWFNSASDLTGWVGDWRPLPGEPIFEHPLPSALSSPRFAEFLAHLGEASCTLIGFSLNDSILATVVDGFHRGHQFRVVSDAVACRRSDACGLPMHRRVILDLIRDFAGVVELNVCQDAPCIGAEPYDER